MAQLAVQSAKASGQAVTYVAAAAGGDQFINNGSTILRVKNGGASSITVTIDSQQQCNHGFDHNLTVTIAAGAETLIGTFDRSRFNDENGNVKVTYSAVTSVTVSPISL